MWRSSTVLTTILLGFCSQAGAQKVVGTIPVGRLPVYVALNTNTNRIYVTNTSDDSVSVIDGKTNRVLTTIPLTTGFCDQVVVNPTTNRIYVATPGTTSSTVTVIDGATNQILTEVVVGSEPARLDVNPKTNRIYVGNFADNTVSVIDGASNTVMTTIANVPGPSSLTVNVNTDLVYVTENPNLTFAGNVAVIDGASNAVVNTFSLAGYTSKVPSLVNVAVDRTHNHLYFLDDADLVLFVVDGASNKVLRVVSGFKMPTFVAAYPNSQIAVVADENGGNVVAVDTSLGQIAFQVHVGDDPSGLAINARTHQIYVANFLSNTVSVVARR